MANWNHCPTEIKLIIVNKIDLDEYDLLDFRLANKECNELSKDRFAQTYFKVRRHFVGKKSFQALVDISKDEFFGPYVKTVQLSAIQGDYESEEPSGERHPGEVSYHITFNEYRDRTELESLLRQAFLNLKAYCTPLVIGLDRYWRSVGDDMPDECYGWLVPSSWKPDTLTVKNAKWADITKNEIIAFNMITSIAKEVELPVKGLKVSLYDNYMIRVEAGEDWEYAFYKPPKEPCDRDLVRDIYKYLEKSPKMDVDIDLTTADYRDEEYPYQSMKVKYERMSKTLAIEKTDTEDVKDFMRPWLAAIQLRSLRLINMHIADGDHIEMLIKNHESAIKRLRMRDCKLKNDYEWNRAICSIASLPALEYLSFTKPSVKNNWNGFFDFFFGNYKRLVFTGDVQEQLLQDLEEYEELVAEDEESEVEDGDEEGEDEDDEDDEESDED